MGELPDPAELRQIGNQYNKSARETRYHAAIKEWRLRHQLPDDWLPWHLAAMEKERASSSEEKRMVVTRIVSEFFSFLEEFERANPIPPPKKNAWQKRPGVSWYKRTRRWRVVTTVNGEEVELGYFKEYADAVSAWDDTQDPKA